MNDRLKELMLEAGYAAPEIAGRANRLAELIVQECAETCKENLVNDAEARAFGLTYNNAVGDCVIQIKQHFGVEE